AFRRTVFSRSSSVRWARTPVVSIPVIFPSTVTARTTTSGSTRALRLAPIPTNTTRGSTSGFSTARRSSSGSISSAASASRGFARAAGSQVHLTAKIGLWDYDSTLADPFVLNHRNFPTATMLADAQLVLGALVGGNGTTTIGCLGGAQVDRFGNINSTRIEPRPFLVGSGGGNDVASTAAENVIVATLSA